MKKYLVFLGLFLVTNISFAQSELTQGTISINGNISFTSTYEESSDLDWSIFIFNPRFDYFVINNLSLGLMLNFENTSFLGKNSSIWGFGPSVRYYLDFKDIKPFAGIGYSYATENASLSDEDFKQNNIILSLGTAYFLTNNVALETILSYTFTNIKYPGEYNIIYSDLASSRNSLSIGLGVNIFLQ